MTVTRPYGTKSIVLDYIRNVGGLATDTVDKQMAAADNDAELFMGVDPSVGIADDYPFHKAIADYVELRAACRLHLMYGDPLDADSFCDKAEKAKASILGNDPSLQAATSGHIGVPLPVTYPSNPEGSRLIGNKQPQIG